MSGTDLESVLGVINKGLSIIETGLESGSDIAPVIQVIKNLTQLGSSVTPEQLADTEATLDAYLNELGGDIPDDAQQQS